MKPNTPSAPSPMPADPLAQLWERLDRLRTALERARDDRRLAAAAARTLLDVLTGSPQPTPAGGLADLLGKILGAQVVGVDVLTTDGLCSDPQCERCAKRRAEQRQAAGPDAPKS